MSDTWSPSSSGTGVQDRAGEVAGAARQQAGEVASTAKEQVASVASTAGEQARTVAGDAKQEVRRLVEDSRRQLRDQAGEQTHRAASSLRDLGDQLQRMASGEAPAEGPAADWARQAAQGVQRFADALERKRPEELLDDARRIARQRPGMFVLGALGAGFLAGRVLRAVDTSAITDAAKSGVGGDGSTEAVSGPGTLGALGAGGMGGGLGAADMGAGGVGAADIGGMTAGGMGGATPADLVDPATAPTSSPQAAEHPPRTEPLRAGPTTGSEW